MVPVTVRSVTFNLAFTNELLFEMNPFVVNHPVMVTLFIVESCPTLMVPATTDHQQLVLHLPLNFYLR